MLCVLDKFNIFRISENYGLWKSDIFYIFLFSLVSDTPWWKWYGKGKCGKLSECWKKVTSIASWWFAPVSQFSNKGNYWMLPKHRACVRKTKCNDEAQRKQHKMEGSFGVYPVRRSTFVHSSFLVCKPINYYIRNTRKSFVQHFRQHNIIVYKSCLTLLEKKTLQHNFLT